MMTERKRRAWLYGAGIALAGILLFLGFGLTLPADPGTRLNGATFLAGLGEYDKAVGVCDEVLEDHPDSIDAHVFKATFLAMAERYDAAIESFDAALERVEDDEVRSSLVLDRASVLLSAGRMEEFKAARDDLAGLGSDYRYQMLEGLAAEHERDWDNAVAAYATAYKLEGDDPQVKSRYWNALVAQGKQRLGDGRFPEAGESFDKARPLFENEPEAHLKAAETRLAMDRPEDAIEILRAVGPQTPGVAPLVFRAATQLMKRGEREAALEALDGALAVDEEAIQILAAKDPAWSALLDDPEVRDILETKQLSDGGGLTADG